MTPISVWRHPTAFLPLLMSAGALAAVLAHLAVYGPAPQADEGTAAHVWQLLMVAQVPIVLAFAFKWLPRAPRQAGIVLALQIAAAGAALVSVLLLGW